MDSFASWKMNGSGMKKEEREEMMQSYPARTLDKRLQVDWDKDPREGPRVLMSLRIDFKPMG